MIFNGSIETTNKQQIKKPNKRDWHYKKYLFCFVFCLNIQQQQKQQKNQLFLNVIINVN